MYSMCQKNPPHRTNKYGVITVQKHTVLHTFDSTGTQKVLRDYGTVRVRHVFIHLRPALL